MSDPIVSNIICFQTKKWLTTLNNVGVLVKSVLIDLRACNFLHAKTSLRALCVHARHRTRNLSSPRKIWRGMGLSFQNWHEEFEEFWPEHSNVWKICTLMGCFWPKYLMFELKKYRGGMSGSTEDWCKIWRKTDLCFQKWHEEFGKFSQAEK